METENKIKKIDQFEDKKLKSDENDNVNEEFLSRFSEFWIEKSVPILSNNDNIDYKIQNGKFNTFKENSQIILDEITPPANRNNLKNFSYNEQSQSDKNLFLNNYYQDTPITGNRSESFLTKNCHSNISNDNQNYNNFQNISNQQSNIDYKTFKPYILNVESKKNYESNNDNQILLYDDNYTKLSSKTCLPDNYETSHNFINSYKNSNHYNNTLWTMSGSDQLPHPSFNSLKSLPQNFINQSNQSTYINGSKLPCFKYFNKSNYEFLNPINNSYSNQDFCLSIPQNSNNSFQNPTKPSLSWIGKFPVKNYPDPLYSNKVFLGGLPWDITEQGLYTVFRQFGPCTFEWPGKDNRSTRHPPKGYVYLIFENERSVKNLLQYCYHDDQGTQFYFKLKTHTCSNEKSIQIIPWILANSSFLKCSSERLDITKTVFVGGLHGKITAENLALVFEELFGSVIYSGIDTDKNKYPIGSGRVTFDNDTSYKNAIQASFVQINGKNFCKKVQIDPYLEDSLCQICLNKNGPFFCKDFDCLRYYCKDCWVVKHCNTENPNMINHRPINRQNSPDVFEILNSINLCVQMAALKQDSTKKIVNQDSNLKIAATTVDNLNSTHKNDIEF